MNIEEEKFAAAVCLHDPLNPSDGGDDGGDDDNSSSEEDIDDDWQTATPRQGLHEANGQDLKEKFLNRLSEVLAREKIGNSGSRRSKAKHAAAAAWINSDDGSPTTTLLTKHEGLHERDRRLLKRLPTWLRAISLIGRAPAIEKDSIWVGLADREGLVEYSRCRLEYYISQICQCKLDFGRLGIDASSADRTQRLCRLCGTSDNSPTTSALLEVVKLAYELRLTDCWRDLDQAYCAKALKAILMLGRLRVAYECFETAAFSFPELRSVELKSTEASCSLGTKVIFTRFDKEVQTLAKSIGRKRLGKGKLAQKYPHVSRLHIHAEIQVLVSLECKPSWRRIAHPYICTSKKLCFLCSQLLRNYVRLYKRHTHPRLPSSNITREGISAVNVTTSLGYCRA